MAWAVSRGSQDWRTISSSFRTYFSQGLPEYTDYRGGGGACVTAFSLWVSSAIYKMHSIPRSFFRCVFYLPVVTGSVAITVVWKWILNPYNGILNQVAGTTGFDWLGTQSTALWFIILILFTTSIGQPIVLYVAALGNVDQSLIEAAQVDGATKLQVFWKIKWPQIMPTTLYVLVSRLSHPSSALR